MESRRGYRYPGTAACGEVVSKNSEKPSAILLLGSMNDTQLLTIALAAVPNVIAVMLGVLINNSRLSDFRAHMDQRFNHVDHRFNDMRDTWRAELHRVEGVLDARLKHLEEQLEGR